VGNFPPSRRFQRLLADTQGKYGPDVLHDFVVDFIQRQEIPVAPDTRDAAAQAARKKLQAALDELLTQDQNPKAS
jgi:hypothetical protein